MAEISIHFDIISDVWVITRTTGGPQPLRWLFSGNNLGRGGLRGFTEAMTQGQAAVLNRLAAGQTIQGIQSPVQANAFLQNTLRVSSKLDFVDAGAITPFDAEAVAGRQGATLADEIIELGETLGPLI
jgi:hypothetical protein